MAERMAITGIYLFFDCGKVYLAPGLMVADGSHLSQRGKWILAQELPRLIERPLNYHLRLLRKLVDVQAQFPPSSRSLIPYKKEVEQVGSGDLRG